MRDLAEILSADSLRVERVLAAPPERVWAYLVEAEKRSSWFCGGDDLTHIGQRFELRFNHSLITDEKPPERYKHFDGSQPDTVSTGEVLAFEPPRLLRFSWNEIEGAPAEVAFELSPAGDGARVVVTHAKLPNRAELVGVGGGWNSHLGVLEDELAGRRNATFWSDHARFEAALEKIVPK